jgi:hypothetical protein
MAAHQTIVTAALTTKTRAVTPTKTRLSMA